MGVLKVLSLVAWCFSAGLRFAGTPRQLEDHRYHNLAALCHLLPRYDLLDSLHGPYQEKTNNNTRRQDCQDMQTAFQSLRLGFGEWQPAEDCPVVIHQPGPEGLEQATRLM